LKRYRRFGGRTELSHDAGDHPAGHGGRECVRQSKLCQRTAPSSITQRERAVEDADGKRVQRTMRGVVATALVTTAATSGLTA
jgi:hypothetical protein